MNTNDKTIQPLEFEKPLLEIQEKINELMKMSQDAGVDFEHEIDKLKAQADEVKGKLYEHLSPSQRMQITRHPQRPNFLEIIHMLSPQVWVEMHGDRAGADDRAILGGLIEIAGEPALIVGTQKGRGMKENLKHNFGMASPEGYRKALRLFEHAEKFRMPVITMIDTPGAYPGMEGEQRGIGQAIAMNIREMARLRTPIISVVLGEASSGGALGIGVADKIFMLEHAIYTVISPEGCASILWRSAEYAGQAAEAMKITAQDLSDFGIVDGIIAEPMGGAHQNPTLTSERILAVLEKALADLSGTDEQTLITERYAKFRKIGAFHEAIAEVS